MLIRNLGSHEEAGSNWPSVQKGECVTRSGLVQPAPDRQISKWSIFAVVVDIRTIKRESDFTSLRVGCSWTTGCGMSLANNHEMVHC